MRQALKEHTRVIITQKTININKFNSLIQYYNNGDDFFVNIRPNGRVFVYKLSGSGFESSCYYNNNS